MSHIIDLGADMRRPIALILTALAVTGLSAGVTAGGDPGRPALASVSADGLHPLGPPACC